MFLVGMRCIFDSPSKVPNLSGFNNHSLDDKNFIGKKIKGYNGNFL